MAQTRDKLEDMDVSFEMSTSLKGPTLQTGITQKWPNIFKSFFLVPRNLKSVEPLGYSGSLEMMNEGKERKGKERKVAKSE